MSGSQIGFLLTQTYTSLSPSGAGLQAHKLGQIYEDGIGNKYKFVKNTHSSAFAISDVVSYDYSGATTTSVFDGATAALPYMAGVAMGAIPASGFGWIQIAGVGSALVDGTTDVAIGDSLKAVNGEVHAVKDQAAGTAPSFGNYMVALAEQTSATDTIIAVHICCGLGA